MHGEQGFIATLTTYLVLVALGFLFFGKAALDWTWVIMVASALFWLGVMKLSNYRYRKMKNFCKKVSWYYSRK